jgi:hypothetical protein
MKKVVILVAPAGQFSNQFLADLKIVAHIW